MLFAAQLGRLRRTRIMHSVSPVAIATLPSPYTHKVSNDERATASRWAKASPYGIDRIEWELWPVPENDPGRAPCLCIWVIECEECVYYVNAPKGPNGAKWSLDFYGPEDGSLTERGRFDSLAAALNCICSHRVMAV